MEEKKIELANALILSLSPTQRQAFAALLLRGGDDGKCFIEDHLTGILHDDECNLGDQLSVLSDCTKCEGTGSVRRKQKEISCSQCKGVGKFEELLPNLAFSLTAERAFVFDMYAGHEDPWETHKYLAEELISALEAERVEEDDEIE